MTELEKTIDMLIKLHGGANVTSVMVSRTTGRNHADICKELGVKRFGEYMDRLSYKVFLSDNPKKMRRSDRKSQFLEAGLMVCNNMSFDEITAHTLTQLMSVSPKLFWSYFGNVGEYKEQLKDYALDKGIEIC